MSHTLWIISELFPPEETSTGYIMGEIANTMTSKYNVKVICGPEIYDKTKPTNYNYKLNDSIEVIRVEGVKENKRDTLSRIKKFIYISHQIYNEAKKRIKVGDNVLMVSNPFPLIILMANLRRKRNFKFSMLVHDVFPESLFSDINLSKPVLSVLSWIFNKSYSTTDHLIVLGRDMLEIMQNKVKKDNKISIIENWADSDNIKPIYMRSEQSKNIVIQYAGNIGKSQGVTNFIDLLHEANSQNIIFDIWGTGSALDEVRGKRIEYEMEDKILLNGSYSRNQQNKVLCRCDIALVTLIEGMYGLGVPSKSYNILAAGRPILFIGERNSEIWLMIEENNVGFCFEPKDKYGIIQFLKGINDINLTNMGKTARFLAENKYSKKQILNKFLDTI